MWIPFTIDEQRVHENSICIQTESSVKEPLACWLDKSQVNHDTLHSYLVINTIEIQCVYTQFTRLPFSSLR